MTSVRRAATWLRPTIDLQPADLLGRYQGPVVVSPVEGASLHAQAIGSRPERARIKPWWGDDVDR